MKVEFKREILPLAALLLFPLWVGAIARWVAKGGISTLEAACMVILLLAFGALAGNYRRNRMLHEALLTVVYSALAVGSWAHSKGTFSVFLCLALVVLFAISAWQCWNTWTLQKDSNLTPTAQPDAEQFR
jgi:hypothetical protein